MATTKKRAAKAPTVAQLTKQYQQLKKSGTFRSSCEGQAFFYEACWSNDAEFEGAFDAFCDRMQGSEKRSINRWISTKSTW